MSRRFDDELNHQEGGVVSKLANATEPTVENRTLLAAALGDGRFPIALTGFCLVLTGGFALLQSASGHLLPQDSHAIGMDATALTHAGNPHLLGFMFHDRVAYGGSLLSIGLGYMWLAGFPLRSREV
jgi:hypothetical protein